MFDNQLVKRRPIFRRTGPAYAGISRGKVLTSEYGGILLKIDLGTASATSLRLYVITPPLKWTFFCAALI